MNKYDSDYLSNDMLRSYISNHRPFAARGVLGENVGERRWHDYIRDETVYSIVSYRVTSSMYGTCLWVYDYHMMQWYTTDNHRHMYSSWTTGDSWAKKSGIMREKEMTRPLPGSPIVELENDDWLSYIAEYGFMTYVIAKSRMDQGLDSLP